MLTPRRSVASLLVAPPNRSELASKPVPAALGAAGGGVGRVFFGVGAVEFGFEGSLTSGTLFLVDVWGLEARTLESMSMAPSVFETATVEFVIDGEGFDEYGKGAAGFGTGVGE